MKELLYTVDYRTNGGEMEQQYLLEVIDKPKKVIHKCVSVRTDAKGNVRELPYTETHTKFLCVNGPLEGQYATESKANSRGYVQYNRAGSYGKQYPTAVLIKL